GPLIGEFGHHRRRRDRENGAAVVDAVGDVSDGRVAIEGRDSVSHRCSPLVSPLSNADAESVRRQRLAGCAEWRRRRQGFGLHFDGMAWALLETDPATRAEVVLDAITSPPAKAYDRLFRTCREAVVAFETIAAGQTPACLSLRLVLAEALHDLGERGA